MDKQLYRIGEDLSGVTLAKALRALPSKPSWNQAREFCLRGKVRVNGELAIDAARRVASGDEIEVDPQAPRIRPNVLSEEALLYFDTQIAVVNKLAGVLSVPFEKAQRDTLVDRTRLLLQRKTGARTAKLGVVQRLDIGTTGVMIFARTLSAERQLRQQFRKHTIERRYLAIAHGKVEATTIESYLVADRGDGLRGSFGAFRRSSRALPKGAQRAVTHIEPVRALRGATLVECCLETGRQHQIRIHLSESGHPIVGERIYIRDYVGKVIPADRPMLHAEVLGFVHPSRLEPMRFEVPPPQDFQDMLIKFSLPH